MKKHLSILLTLSILSLLFLSCAAENPEPTFYATTKGNYYHSDQTCCGMHNAQPIDKTDALLSGKQPCPVCCTKPFYATTKGNYYHSDQTCCGMHNAQPIDESDALLSGKQPCPVCCTTN